MWAMYDMNTTCEDLNENYEIYCSIEGSTLRAVHFESRIVSEQSKIQFYKIPDINQFQ